ncbi:hypothetical protein ACFYXS_02740 [Streptomyces sp. NPDC002574]|uniref:deazapurine DNA modification protein DpdA family protein n=1 Tax=Streptomyces sp. NPDC002574 TaxID=3364652 RepID=UPI0036B8EFFE
MTVFFLGTHIPSWLATTEVPLFVSHRRLTKRRTLPRARTDWALDSGGFTELSMYGGWTTEPADYIRAVRRYRDEIGNLAWAAPQDWMVEPFMLRRTGLTVADHQRRTVENFERLRDMAPDLPIVPVIQGWTLSDYRLCVDEYVARGVDLLAEPTVGIGSVCRRQGTREIGAVVETLAADGIRLHGFGVKLQGLRAYRQHLTSADSMAWSYSGRHKPGCGPSHKSESNCLKYALTWREKALC